MTPVPTARRAALRFAIFPSPLARVAVFTRVLVTCTVLAALLFGSRSAQAQTVTGIVGPVLRYEPTGGNADDLVHGNPHSGSVPLNVVNYEDCEANLHYKFTLSLSADYPQYDLVAWAGPTDCTAAAARESPGATCWPLGSAALAQTSMLTDAGLEYRASIDVNMRDLAAHASGTTAIPTTYATQTDDSACRLQATTAQSSIAIYFFFTNHVGPGDAVGIAQAYPIIVDTVAASVGAIGYSQDLDSQLTVSIPASSDPDTVLYNVYCDPPPGKETAANLQVPYDAATNNGQCLDSGGDANDGATEAEAAAEASAGNVEDASAEDASGVDAAGSTATDSGSGKYDDAGGNACGVPLGDSGIPSPGGACSSDSVLQSGGSKSVSTLGPEKDDAGQDVTNEAGSTIYVEAGNGEAGAYAGGTQTLGIPAVNLCGTIAVTDTSITLTGLKDGYYYTLAVAAVDGAGNVGPLAVTCGSPVQLADFWYKYAAAGGQAGGGYCSAAEGIGVPAGTSGLGILMVASIIGLVRTRKRRR